MARATEPMAHLRAASGHLLKSSDDIKRKSTPEIKQFVHGSPTRPNMPTDKYGAGHLHKFDVFECFSMKKTACVLLVGLSALTGCAHSYVMTLTNGTQIFTASKPRLERSSYYYKDARGRDCFVPAGRVREIAPASMVKEEKPMFGAPPKK